MTSAIRGAEQSKRNINDSISLLQVADGVMANSLEILQRLRELAVQAGNATYSNGDRAALQLEASQLLQGITASANQARFNGDALFSHNTTSIGGRREQARPHRPAEARLVERSRATDS
jgi:flagellin